jgi:hypothetical protein
MEVNILAVILVFIVIIFYKMLQLVLILNEIRLLLTEAIYGVYHGKEK